MTGTFLDLCPTPEKSFYRTRKAAKAYARKNHFDTRPYKCACGFFHLGHQFGMIRAEHRAAHAAQASSSAALKPEHAP